jgi:hypothetical protein
LHVECKIVGAGAGVHLVKVYFEDAHVGVVSSQHLTHPSLSKHLMGTSLMSVLSGAKARGMWKAC